MNYILPYVEIPKEILIPHPGSAYSLSLSKDQFMSFDIDTQILKINTIVYKDCFVLLLKDIKTHAVLCMLDELYESDAEVYCNITCLKKIRVLLIKDKTITFSILKEKISTQDIQDIETITQFIKITKAFEVITNNVNLKDPEDYYLLDKVINYLYPTIEEEISFFKEENLSNKITTINSLIITYCNDFQIIKTNLPTNKPLHIQQILNKEKDRLNIIPKSSNEYSATLDYIEILESLPWEPKSINNLDINKIKEHLDSTHYGLDYLKKTIIDHFAFEHLTQKQSGTILLFHGPPGTGKTSIAKTIAKAIDRELISIALGGISDESEIRGHRRTYVSSRPGRLISAFKHIKYNNPVILLDEIDKISASSKGDPSAALLEVLDVEQNDKFIDKFLEVPFDLSNALFICTSNNLSTISKPLLDRLEVVYFNEYTFEEKYEIASNHIIPDLLSKYDLETYNIVFTEELLLYLSKNKNLRDLKKIIFRFLKHASYEILNGSQSIYITLDLYLKYYSKKERKLGFK